MAPAVASSSSAEPASQQQASASQGQRREASWSPPGSANAAEPTSAVPSSIDPPHSQPIALHVNLHPSAQRDRPRAPYLTRPAVHHNSRHRPYPISTAAADRDTRTETCSSRPTGVQTNGQVAPVNAAAAGEAAAARQLRHQVSSHHGERQAAEAARLSTHAVGVIDLTADEDTSPISSSSSDWLPAWSRVTTLTAPTQSGEALANALPEADARLTETDARLTETDVRLTQSDPRLTQTDVRLTASPSLAMPSSGRTHATGTGQVQAADQSEDDARQPTAQAQATSARRSRWDVMPQHMSGVAPQPLLSPASPADVPVQPNATQDKGQRQNRTSHRDGLHAASVAAPRFQQHRTVTNGDDNLSRQSTRHTHHKSRRHRHRHSTSKHRRHYSRRNSHDSGHDHACVDFGRHRSARSSSRHSHKQARRNAGLPENCSAPLSADRVSQNPVVEPDGVVDRVSMGVHVGQDDRWQMWQPHGV